MNNIAIIQQGTGRYLFSLPENVTLREGDRVKCSTKRGITDGVAFADSAWVDENVSQLLGKLTGAKFPLKSVVGKMEYQPFEKPQDKPSNKYEGMSNTQLKIEMCTRGRCRAHNGGRRKLDCLFADDDRCSDVTDANRAKVIKYLLAEDAEADPQPQVKPSEDKQEPIKLYCRKDSIFGEAEFTEGTVCTFNPSVGALELPDGSWLGDGAKPRSYDDWKADNPSRADCLVPLVKRPAKNGEWIYPTTSNGDLYSKGEIARVTHDDTGDNTVFIKAIDVSSGGCWIHEQNYLVLDGYKPEKEPEPEKNCENCKKLCIINKAPVYAYCSEKKKVFELFQKDTRTDVCDDWSE